MHGLKSRTMIGETVEMYKDSPMHKAPANIGSWGKV